MSPFSPLYYIKQNKVRCILLMLMLMLSAVIYVGGLYVTAPVATFDLLKESNEKVVRIYDYSVVDYSESDFDKVVAEIEKDNTLDYIYASSTPADFQWNTVMNFSCGSNEKAFGSVEDFKKHCQITGLEADFSNLKRGSLILTQMLADNLGLSLGDKIDENYKNKLVSVDEGATLTVDLIIDQQGYGAYIIGEESPKLSLYLYGINISGAELKSKALAFEEKYNVIMGYTSTEEIDEQFASFNFIYAFIVILVSVIIAITINTAFAGMFQKRNYEFAVYRAIGISKGKILRKLVCELLLIDGIALVAGTAITALFLYLFNNIALYPDGLYLEYFHPLALMGVIICNLVSLVPLILFRIGQIKKADICEY
ncbi:MAG: ABC transporter permease [Ruminococcus sp.]|nr:ABC transporter permease [Ruminococcus sp.]